MFLSVVQELLYISMHVTSLCNIPLVELKTKMLIHARTCLYAVWSASLLFACNIKQVARDEEALLNRMEFLTHQLNQSISVLRVAGWYCFKCVSLFQ